MQQASLYQQYKNQSLETLTPGEMVIKLLEEASKQVSMAIFLTNQKDYLNSYNSITKAQTIISTLESSLDRNYAISIELIDHYQFLYASLSKAVTKNDTELMKRLLFLIDDLKSTFKQADRLARSRR